MYHQDGMTDSYSVGIMPRCVQTRQYRWEGIVLMQIRRNKSHVDIDNLQANWLFYISIQISDSLVLHCDILRTDNCDYKDYLLL
jgi:hypothetical protein